MYYNTGGEGRTGMVLSLYLMHRYDLSASEAAEEIVQNALKCGVSRRPNLKKIEKFETTKTLGSH